MVIKTIIIIIFCLLFLYDILLKVISLKSVSNKIPDNVRDVYDRTTYQKWQSYYREKLRLSLISGSVSFLIELILLGWNIYAAFAGLFPDTLLYGRNSA